MSKRRLKKFVFHLGPHKTGTSFIQNSVREELQGSLTKTRGVRHLADRKKLAWLIGAQPKIKKLWEDVGNDALSSGRAADIQFFANAFAELVLTLEKYQTVALVAENRIGKQLGMESRQLYPNAENAARIWKSVAAELAKEGVEMQLFGSFRSQPDFVESTFVNLVRGGLHMPFAEYYGGLDRKSLSWYKFWSRILKHFPKDKVTIVPFEFVKKNPKAFIFQMTGQFDPPLRLKTLSDNKRTGLSDMGLKVCHEAYYNIIDSDDRSEFAKKVLERFPKSEWGSPKLLTKDDKQKLKAQFEKDNRKLFDKFVDPRFHYAMDKYYAP